MKIRETQINKAVADFHTLEINYNRVKMEIANEYQTALEQYGSQLHELYDQLKHRQTFAEFIATREEISIIKNKILALESRRKHKVTPLI